METERVRTYQPTQQFVIVFEYGGAVSSYTIRFVQMGDTFVVEAT
jgi:hypothetical protein